eukprot:COSAG01_NODE_4811_length_4725_cov_29.418720_3_plen_353_part_00
MVGVGGVPNWSGKGKRAVPPSFPTHRVGSVPASDQQWYDANGMFLADRKALETLEAAMVELRNGLQALGAAIPEALSKVLTNYDEGVSRYKTAYGKQTEAVIALRDAHDLLKEKTEQRDALSDKNPAPENYRNIRELVDAAPATTHEQNQFLDDHLARIKNHFHLELVLRNVEMLERALPTLSRAYEDAKDIAKNYRFDVEALKDYFDKCMAKSAGSFDVFMDGLKSDLRVPKPAGFVGSWGSISVNDKVSYTSRSRGTELLGRVEKIRASDGMCQVRWDGDTQPSLKGKQAQLLASALTKVPEPHSGLSRQSTVSGESMCMDDGLEPIALEPTASKRQRLDSGASFASTGS